MILFHKKGPILVILVPGMIQPARSVIFRRNEAVEANEATEVVEALEPLKVLRSGRGLFKSYPSSFTQLYFDVLKIYRFGRMMKYYIEI